jgi:hypothetical protein
MSLKYADYKIKYDTAYGLPIKTKHYTLHLVEQFLGRHYLDKNCLTDVDDDWGQQAGEAPCRSRRILLYAVREAALYGAEPDRMDQLIQLCRKYKTRQPTYWPRFLRERYQYAKTDDFFSVDYNDIIHEFYSYDQEMRELSADPEATGRVFDAKQPWQELVKTINQIVVQSSPKRHYGKVLRTDYAPGEEPPQPKDDN